MKTILYKLTELFITLLATVARNLIAPPTMRHAGQRGMVDAAAFERNRVTNAGFAEIIAQPLYDYQLLVGTGSQRLTFFQQQQGQGITSALGATVGSVKTFSDTNMQLSSQLSSGMQFLCQNIEVQFYPGSVSTANTYTPATITAFNAVASATVGAQVNDSNTFYQSGLLEFNVLNKNYVRDTPLIKFVPMRSFDLTAAVASNSATTGEVVMAVLRPSGLPYDLDPEIALNPATNFDVTISWPAVVPLPSGFNARVGVVMNGYQKRAGQ